MLLMMLEMEEEEEEERRKKELDREGRRKGRGMQNREAEKKRGKEAKSGIKKGKKRCGRVFRPKITAGGGWREGEKKRGTAGYTGHTVVYAIWVALGHCTYSTTQTIDELCYFRLPSVAFTSLNSPMANLSLLIGQLLGQCRKVYAPSRNE